MLLRQFHEPPVSPRAVCMAGVCCDKILTGRRKEGFVLSLSLSLIIFSGGRYKKGHILILKSTKVNIENLENF